MPAHSASVDVGTVRQRFNFEWAMSEPVDGVDTYWWWARSIRVDPNEVVADDGEGNLWSVPWSTDGEDAVTFGEPIRVRETFVPVTASGDGAAATAVVQRRRQRVLPGGAALEKPEKPDRSNPAASAATTQEEPTMDVDTTLLRRRLGLADDATEEQITEALSTEPEEPAAGVPEEEVEQRVETAVAAARQEERQKASASADGTVVFDKQAAEQLQADAKAGREARDEQISSDRDRAVAAAVEDGRIPPARREHWRKALDADPEGAAATLNGLDKGLIPVTQRGSAASADDSSTDHSEGTGWFPSTQKEG